MSNLERIVSVGISTAGAIITTASFSTMMILGAHSAFPERARSYTNMDGIKADFASTSAVYRAANVAFSQRFLRPSKIIVGRRDASGIVAQVDAIAVSGTVSQGDTLTVRFGAHETITIVASATDSGPDLEARLVAEIAKRTWPVTAILGGASGVIITSDWPGVPHTLTASITGAATATVSNTTANVGSTESITDALDAIEGEGAVFFGLALLSTEEADQNEAKLWIEARKRVAYFRTDDASVKGASTTDRASVAKSESVQNSGWIWHHSPWTFPDVSMLAGRLSVNPDNAATTWEFMKLVGVPSTPGAALSSTEIDNLESKNVAYYIDVAGSGTALNVKMAVGEYPDVVVGVYWLIARMEEAIFVRKQNSALAGGKLTYTDEGGIAVIDSLMREKLEVAVDTDFVQEGYTIDLPLAASKTIAQRQAREYDGITFFAQLAGAIHFTGIQGYLEA